MSEHRETPAGSQPSRYRAALADVSKVFGTPRSVLAATDLTEEEKIALLQQWEIDLRLLLVASEENMPGTEVGRTGDLLRQVRDALAHLGVAQTDDIAGAANKSGGA